MQYQKFQPAEKLQPFVECYFTWEGTVTGEELVIESPPNGFCSIVFNYGDPYFLHNKKYERLAVPMQFIAGQSIYSYQLFLHGAIGVAGIVFKPAALSTLFQLPMYEYTEERKDLYHVFKKEEIDKYAAAIKNADDTHQRVRLLEEFILHEYDLQQPKPDYIDEAASLIVAKNGMLQVNELLQNSFMSRRTFERKFFQKVGLSPKYYARIRRIGYLCNLVAGKKKVDWPQVFHECEFYDQAHFIKDFLEFTGRTPQQYLKENAELANFVDKPKQRPI